MSFILLSLSSLGSLWLPYRNPKQIRIRKIQNDRRAKEKKLNLRIGQQINRRGAMDTALLAARQADTDKLMSVAA